MAACTEFRLGRQRFASRDLQLSVTVTAIAELSWRSAGSEVLGPYASAERVAQLVRAGRLWIGCGGSAFGLVVYPTLQRQDILLRGNSNGRVKDGTCSAAGWLAKAVLSWPAWDRLGLIVRLDGSDEDGAGRWQSGDRRWDAGRLFFSVTHPSSPGGLCAPAGVPQAQFRRVVCRLNFALHPGGPEQIISATAEANVEAKRIKRHGKTRSQATVAQSETRRSTRIRASNRRRRVSKLAKAPASTIFGDCELRRKASTLIEASLYVLVGIKGRVLGVRPIEPFYVKPLPSLISIAPAVWNYRHFQDVSAHAVFVPQISSLLMDCCINAQSPSLRQKAAVLLEGPEDEKSGIGNLESKLHEILLKCVSTHPKRNRRKLGGPSIITTSDHVENLSNVPELDIQPFHTYEFDGQRHGSANAETASRDETHSCYAANEDFGRVYDEHYATDGEDAIWPWDDDNACWQEIADWPGGEESCWETDDSLARQYEPAEHAHLDEVADGLAGDIDWQEIEDWQLEDWEAREADEFRGGSVRYTDEETESEMEYMDVNIEDVHMWQDGYELFDVW